MVSSILAGCATQSMTPSNVKINNKFDKTVYVVAESDPIIFGLKRSDYFGPAIENAIRKQGPFSRVVQEKEADYRLEVDELFFRCTQAPVLFLDAKAENTMLWTLKPIHSDKTVWQEQITCHYEAGIFDSLFSWIAVVRARRAGTGIVQENIRIGLEKLSSLSLNGMTNASNGPARELTKSNEQSALSGSQ